MNCFYEYETILGRLKVAGDEAAIHYIMLGEECYFVSQGYEKLENKLLKEAGRQLKEYFKGSRKAFDLPLAPGGTDFQKKVWEVLCKIPYGVTKSYKEIAENIGCLKGYRAVGMANNRNPIMIVIPCHRVIGSNGKLVGYAGGLHIKERLLQLEKTYV